MARPFNEDTKTKVVRIYEKTVISLLTLQLKHKLGSIAEIVDLLVNNFSQLEENQKRDNQFIESQMIAMKQMEKRIEEYELKYGPPLEKIEERSQND